MAAPDVPFDGFDEMRDLYLEEAAEHIGALARSLLAMEHNDEIDNAVREAFRAAHSLKGMAATMGFAGTTAVTHELEALLEMLRAGNLSPTDSMVSTMLNSCDTLEQLLQDIVASGIESAPISHIISDLNRYVSEQNPDGAASTAPHLTPATSSSMLVSVEVSDQSSMPSVRAFQMLARLEQCGQITSCEPARESIEAGSFPGGWITVELVTTHDHDAVVAAAAGTDVSDVRVEAVGDCAAVQAPAASPVEVGIERTVRRSQPNRTVRVAAERLDKLMHGVEELLVRRSQLHALVAEHGITEIATAVTEMDRAARYLQELVMDVRMISVESVFRLVPRLVRDLTRELGKQVELDMSGHETEIDRTVVEVLSDPLVHLIRNAIDHGIETPAERVAAGKPPSGSLAVSARSEGATVVIEVRDDGRGFDIEHIRQRCVDRGLLSGVDARDMSDDDLVDMCFSPGFSTRDSVNRISGRGVGLDVVRSDVRSLGGDVTITTHASGSAMAIKLPLTLAIRSVLAVNVGNESYCFHSDRVGMTLDIKDLEIHSIAGQPACMHMGRVVPLIELGAALGIGETTLPPTHVVIVDTSRGQVALCVTGIIGQREVVTRALSGAVSASALIAATAVLGDGAIAFLIDTDMIDVMNMDKGTIHAVHG